MARLVHSINVAADGGCHHADTVADAGHHAYALDLLRSSAAVLLGRNTFDLFADFWPDAARRDDLPAHVVAFARALDRARKGVATSRTLDSGWGGVERLAGPGLDATRGFLDAIAGTVVVFGSPGLGTSLAEAGLVDEFHLLLQPFIGAAAPRAFAGLSSRQRLHLLEARTLDSGTVLLRYATDR